MQCCASTCVTVFNVRPVLSVWRLDVNVNWSAILIIVELIRDHNLHSLVQSYNWAKMFLGAFDFFLLLGDTLYLCKLPLICILYAINWIKLIQNQRNTQLNSYLDNKFKWNEQKLLTRIWNTSICKFMPNLHNLCKNRNY